MTRHIAIILNQLFSGGLSALGGGLAVSASIFGLLWGLASAAGLAGSPTTVIVLLLASVLPTVAVLGLRPVRWTVVAWVLRSNIDRVVQFGPKLIIGIGPGGAIISGMMAKVLADRMGAEPRVYVIDRTYKWEGNALGVSLSEALTGPVSASGSVKSKGVLLASSEVHTGSTMKMVSEYLSGLGIEHKSFSLICSPSSGFAVDYTVIRSDKRGLLPWHDAPEREREGEV